VVEVTGALEVVVDAAVGLAWWETKKTDPTTNGGQNHHDDGVAQDDLRFLHLGFGGHFGLAAGFAVWLVCRWAGGNANRWADPTVVTTGDGAVGAAGAP